mgnify:CR=1 FL=1
MNKIGFTFSGIFVITGIITLLQTTIINLVMPKIGKVAFQFAINVAAICLVVVGVALGFKFFKTK